VRGLDRQQRRPFHISTRLHLEQSTAVLAIALLHPVVVNAESPGFDRVPKRADAVGLGREPRNGNVLHGTLGGNLADDCKSARGDNCEHSTLETPRQQLVSCISHLLA